MSCRASVLGRGRTASAGLSTQPPSTPFASLGPLHRRATSPGGTPRPEAPIAAEGKAERTIPSATAVVFRDSPRRGCVSQGEYETACPPRDTADPKRQSQPGRFFECRRGFGWSIRLRFGGRGWGRGRKPKQLSGVASMRALIGWRLHARASLTSRARLHSAQA